MRAKETTSQEASNKILEEFEKSKSEVKTSKRQSTLLSSFDQASEPDVGEVLSVVESLEEEAGSVSQNKSSSFSENKV